MIWVLLAAGLNAGALALLRMAGLQITWQHSTLTLPLNGLLALLAGVVLYAGALLVTLRILTLFNFSAAVPLPWLLLTMVQPTTPPSRCKVICLPTLR